MAIVTLTATQFADLVRTKAVVMLPVAVSGFIYGVIRGEETANIYRVAVA